MGDVFAAEAEQACATVVINASPPSDPILTDGTRPLISSCPRKRAPRAAKPLLLALDPRFPRGRRRRRVGTICLVRTTWWLYRGNRSAA